MNWIGYPVLTHGVSTDTGRFFFTHVTLSSHEDTRSWATNFRFVKRKAGIPRFNMADGAWEISKVTSFGKDDFWGEIVTFGGLLSVVTLGWPLFTKYHNIPQAADEVFGPSLTNLRSRLMCWSHVYRNIRPKLASIRRANKLLAESILSDIEALQWMCQTAAEFNRLTELLVQHYSTNPALSVSDLSLVSSFFEYFLLQWGPGSHVQNWYAGDSSKMHIHMDPTRSGHTISKY